MDNPTGHITENFMWEEFYCHCYKCVIPPHARKRILIICTRILQPIRTELGAAIHVCSGFRCLDHNHAIGGVSKSQHMNGAADIVVRGYTPKWINKFIEDNFKVGGLGLYPWGNHLDPRRGNARWYEI